jgi:sugar phosphate isomerase/epimerase
MHDTRYTINEKNMNIGISTGCFFPRVKTEDTFNLIKKLGVNTVEVFLSTFSEYKEEFGKLLKERLNSIHNSQCTMHSDVRWEMGDGSQDGINLNNTNTIHDSRFTIHETPNIYSIHTLNQQFEPELFNSSERTRGDCEVFFKQAAHVGKELGAKYYIFHGPARLKKKPYNIDYKKFGFRCDELNDMLSEFNLQLLYENVHWAFFNSPEFILNLKKHSNVNVCLDIKQAMQGGICVYDYIEAMGDRIKNVHLCDYDENGKLSVAGKGKFDFVKLFKRLKDIGYNKPCMLEVYSGDYGDFDELKQGIEHLRECLDKAK